MKKIISIVFILYVLCACTTKDISSEMIIVDNTDFCDWWSLMKIDDILPLQDTTSAPKLSVARKCVVGKERLLFWDYRAKLVYAYDTNGNYLFTVGGIGRSDREYVDISDIAFSPNQKEIQILDGSGIKVFDAKDGHFIRKLQFRDIESSSIKGFLPCEENAYLLFTPDKEYSIYKVDNENNIIPLRKRNGYQMIYKRFASANGKAIVLPDYGNFRVDYVQDDKIIPAYDINIESSLPKSLIPKDYNSFVQVDDMKDYFKLLLDYYENSNFVYASMVGPNQTYYDLIYAKSNGKVYAGPHDKETSIVFTGMDDDYLYGLIYLDYVKSDTQNYERFRPYIDAGILNPLFVKIKIK